MPKSWVTFVKVFPPMALRVFSERSCRRYFYVRAWFIKSFTYFLHSSDVLSRLVSTLPLYSTFVKTFPFFFFFVARRRETERPTLCKILTYFFVVKDMPSELNTHISDSSHGRLL